MLQKTSIAGRDFHFSGEENDPYFQRLSAFVAGNRVLQNYIDHHITFDSVCLDVGANIGLTAVPLANKCSHGRVFAFEPSPINAKHLRENLRRAGFNHVNVVEAAVGSRAGFVNLNIIPSDGSHSTVLRGDVGVAHYATVPIITIDEWVAERNLPRIDFIKIDVEGFEPDVLCGGATIISRHRPTIFMEFNSVTTMFEARINPLLFAEAIWQVFDVSTVQDEGTLVPIEDPRGFTFFNMTEHGCCDDIVMRLRPDVTAEALLAAMPRSAPTAMA